MKDVAFVGIIPAENPVQGEDGVNILLMVDNRGEATRSLVRFYASDGGPWREIFAQEREFPEKTHIHAYFHLPESCFAPELWGGEKPEELSLYAGESEPQPNEQVVLLFFA